MSKLKYFNVFERSGGRFGDDEFIFSYDDGVHTIFNRVNEYTLKGIKYLIDENKKLKKTMEEAIEMLNHPWTLESGNEEVDEETHKRKLEVIEKLRSDENE